MTKVESSESLKGFVEALIKRRENQAGELSPVQRREVAESLSLKLADIEAEAGQLLEAGQALAAEEDWDGAMELLFDAAAVYPRRADVVLALTRAVAGCYRVRREEVDKELGIRLARRAVELDTSTEEEVEEIIEELEAIMPRRASLVPRSAALFLIVGMLFLMFMMILLSVLVVT